MNTNSTTAVAISASWRSAAYPICNNVGCKGTHTFMRLSAPQPDGHHRDRHSLTDSPAHPQYDGGCHSGLCRRKHHLNTARSWLAPNARAS